MRELVFRSLGASVVFPASLSLVLLTSACAAPQPPLQHSPSALAEPTTRTISFTASERTYLAFTGSVVGRKPPRLLRGERPA